MDNAANELLNQVLSMQNQFGTFLLEFIRELNEFKFEQERNGLADSQTFDRTIENFKKLASEAMSTDNLEFTASEDAPEVDRLTMQKFVGGIQKMISDGNPFLTNEEKQKLRVATRDSLQACVNLENYEGIAEFTRRLKENGAISAELEAELADMYRSKYLEEASEKKEFAVTQIPVENNPKLIANVQREMKNRGIEGAFFTLTQPGEKPGAFVHLMNPRDRDILMTIVDRENMNLTKCTLRSPEFVDMLADMYGDTVKNFEGLTKAEAEKLNELTFGRIPCAIDKVEGIDGPDTWSVRFLDSNSGYMNKLLAEAISQTHGYAQDAKEPQRMEHYQESREKVNDFITQLHESMNPQESCYLIDLRQYGSQEDYEKEAHRLFITKDYFTETRGNQVKTIEAKDCMKKYGRSYEEMLDISVRNFSKHMVFVSEMQAKEMNLNNQRFRYNDALKEYLQSYAIIGVSPETREAYEHESEFMHWAISNSEKEDVASILGDIRDNTEEYIKRFSEKAHEDIDKKYRLTPEYAKQAVMKYLTAAEKRNVALRPSLLKDYMEKYKIPSEADKELGKQKHENVDRRKEALLRDDGRTLKTHIKEMADSLTEDRSISERIAKRTERAMSDETVDRNTISEFKFKESRLQEDINAYDEHQSKVAPDNQVRDIHDMRALTAESIEKSKENIKAQLLKQHPELERRPAVLETYAQRAVQFQDLTNMIQYNSAPVLPATMAMYNEVNADVINAQWNTNHTPISKLTNTQLQEHISEIRAAAQDVVKSHDIRPEQARDDRTR